MLINDRWIDADGDLLFARVWSPPEPRGSGAGIVLLHDSLGCVELWRDFPARLAAATRLDVAAYDRLGFGRSDPPPRPATATFIEEEAEVMIPRVCGALGFGPVIVFGHSVGGAMAISAAARMRDRCRAVITESAQSFVEERTLTGIRSAQADFEQPERFQRLARYHGAKARRVLDTWVETWLGPDFAGWSLDTELQRVRCPVLALHGDRDEYGSREHADRIVRLSGSAWEAVIVEDSGHVPHREQQERVLEEVVRFLARAVRED